MWLVAKAQSGAGVFSSKLSNERRYVRKSWSAGSSLRIRRAKLAPASRNIRPSDPSGNSIVTIGAGQRYEPAEIGAGKHHRVAGVQLDLTSGLRRNGPAGRAEQQPVAAVHEIGSQR